MCVEEGSAEDVAERVGVSVISIVWDFGSPKEFRLDIGDLDETWAHGLLSQALRRLEHRMPKARLVGVDSDPLERE